MMNRRGIVKQGIWRMERNLIEKSFKQRIATDLSLKKRIDFGMNRKSGEFRSQKRDLN
jgi:hypothetical protein